MTKKKEQTDLEFQKIKDSIEKQKEKLAAFTFITFEPNFTAMCINYLF